MTLSVDILEQAKTALQSHGWTKGDLVSCDTGELCALGALGVALGVKVEQAEDSRYRLVFPHEAFQPAAEDLAALGEHPSSATLEQEQDWRARSSELWRDYDKAAAEYEERFQGYDRVLQDAVHELSGGAVGYVTTWNDRPESTLQDVLDVFDRAIEIIKQKEESASV